VAPSQRYAPVDPPMVLMCPIQNLPHLHMPPLPTVSGSDLPSVELPGDGVEACMTSRLDVPNDRQHVGGELRCLRLAGHASAGPGRQAQVPARSKMLNAGEVALGSAVA
jgi:hypothetical protein